MLATIRAAAITALFATCASPLSAHPDAFGQAQALLDEMVANDEGSGAMAAIVQDGEVIWHGESGFADLENKVRMKSDSRLRIGSVSKFLTAVLALKMQDEGKVDLSGQLGAYVHDLEDPARKVTLEQLGRHLSGIRHYDFANFEEANNRDFFARLPVRPTAALAGPLPTAPGAAFEYSSIGYNLLGLALEREASVPFPQLFAETLAKPMQLSNTLANDQNAIIERRARFYSVTAANPAFQWMEDGQLINTIYRDDSDLYPSGGMLSNAIDLAQFTAVVFETEFLSEASRAELTTPTKLASGVEARLGRDKYGFGTILYKQGEDTIAYGHGGLTNGGQAEVLYFPQERLAIAVVANYNVMGPSGLEKFARETLPDLFRQGS